FSPVIPPIVSVSTPSPSVWAPKLLITKYQIPNITTLSNNAALILRAYEHGIISLLRATKSRAAAGSRLPKCMTDAPHLFKGANKANVGSLENGLVAGACPYSNSLFSVCVAKNFLPPEIIRPARARRRLYCAAVQGIACFLSCSTRLDGGDD